MLIGRPKASSTCSGCRAFVSKPVDLDQLPICLAEVLGAEACKTVSQGVEVADRDTERLKGPDLFSDSSDWQPADTSHRSQHDLDVADHSVAFEQEEEDDYQFRGPVQFSVPRSELLEMLGNGTSEESPTVTAVPVAPLVSATQLAAGDGVIRSSLPLDDAESCQIVSGFAGRLQAEVTAMHRALDDGDLDEVARLAHWLKDAAGTMGFGAFTDPGMQLVLWLVRGRLCGSDRFLPRLATWLPASQLPGWGLRELPK